MKQRKTFLLTIAAILLAAFVMTGCPSPTSSGGGKEATGNPFIGTWLSNPETDNGVTLISEYQFGSKVFTSYVTITASTNQNVQIHERTKYMQGTYTYNEADQTITVTNTYTGYQGVPAKTFTWGGLTLIQMVH